MQYGSSLRNNFLESQQKERAFVIYSLPGSVESVSFTSSAFSFLNSLPDNIQDGFIIHPFKVSENNPIIWITENEELQAAPAKRSPSLSMQNLNHDQNKYTDFVRQIQNQIEAGHIKKVVASRPFFADVKEGWQVFDYYQKLSNKYPNAFTYLFSIPGIGTWCGATPELLVNAQDNKIQLVSLAGTKTPDKEWTQKEKQEQAFVTNYIETLLQRNGCQNIGTGETQTIQAGSVQHLKTTISAELNTAEQLFTLVKDLHPTPAVGGLPKNAAMELILEKESYDRKYYTGFLGPVKAKQTKLFVNLRCLEALGDSVCLYLGAGITAASNPDAEWEETKLKANTLLSVLNE